MSKKLKLDKASTMTATALEVREALTEAEVEATYPVFSALRPQIGALENFVTIQKRLQSKQGYRIAYICEPGTKRVVGVAGFNLQECLWVGEFVYVFDLCTLEEFRGQGYGEAIMDWVVAEAKRMGVKTLHLDSGVQRFGAHRFYLSKVKMSITCHHFEVNLDGLKAADVPAKAPV